MLHTIWVREREINNRHFWLTRRLSPSRICHRIPAVWLVGWLKRATEKISSIYLDTRHQSDLTVTIFCWVNGNQRVPIFEAWIVKLHLLSKNKWSNCTWVQKKELKFQVTVDVYIYHYNNIWQLKQRITKKMIKMNNIWW